MLQKQSALPAHTTKTDLAIEVLGHHNFDTALPQQALDSLARNNEEYDLLRFGLVTSYAEQNYGFLMPITLDAKELLDAAKGDYA